MISGNLLTAWLDTSEIFRVEVSLLAFSLFAILERFLPCRAHQWSGRVAGNAGLHLINVLTQFGMILFTSLTLSAFSLFALFHQFGLLNHLQMGLWTKIIMAWLILDLASYWWHRLWHRIPLLWRFHRIHHLDPALDVLTTFRTHPVELILTILFKGCLIYLLGAPLLGVILYEMIVVVMAMWIHSNIRILSLLDRWLSWIVITPILHRLHHRTQKQECSCNYGLVLSVWDRIFGSYRTDSSQGLSGPGLESSDAGPALTLAGMIMIPFRKSSSLESS